MIASFFTSSHAGLKGKDRKKIKKGKVLAIKDGEPKDKAKSI